MSFHVPPKAEPKLSLEALSSSALSGLSADFSSIFETAQSRVEVPAIYQEETKIMGLSTTRGEEAVAYVCVSCFVEGTIPGIIHILSPSVQ